MMRRVFSWAFSLKESGMALEIEYLGHSGLLISDGVHTVAVDPFLSDCPTAVRKVADIRCTDVVLTHGHFDHVADAPQIIKNSGATFYGAWEICNWLSEQNLKAAQPMNPGGKVVTPFGFVALTQAIHSSSLNGAYMGNPCGAIIRIGGHTIYHTGDTALFSDMKLIGELYKPEIVFVCAGDRFTMGPEHAAMAADWVGAQHAVPIHWGTWPPLAQEADLMADFKPSRAKVRMMKPGDKWHVA
jgi:L-ascorbate metabolism protein UlaG (beta-lactamase superfamily)